MFAVFRFAFFALALLLASIVTSNAEAGCRGGRCGLRGGKIFAGRIFNGERQPLRFLASKLTHPLKTVRGLTRPELAGTGRECVSGHCLAPASK